MRLNLGCGKDVKKGYLNIDIRDLPGVIVADVSDPIVMLRFFGAEEILAYDIIEHLPRQVAHDTLRLWYDMLANGGVLRIRCPDILHATSLRDIRGDEWLEQLLYGGQDYPENQHLCGFTRGMMERLLEQVGFTSWRITNNNAGNMDVEARK